MGGLMSRYFTSAAAHFSSARKKPDPEISGTDGRLGRQTVYALGFGFITVFLGSAVLGGGYGKVFAEDNGAGIHAFLQSEGSKLKARLIPPIFRASAPVAAVTYFAAPQMTGAVASFETAKPLPLIQPRPGPRIITRRDIAKLARLTASAEVDASGLPQRSVCVRLCDGFYFPIATANNESDLAGHEAICTGLCPGAPTRVFIIPGGTDRIEDAVTREGKSYSALPVAFRHQGTSDNTCSCRRANQSHASLVSLYKDFTLRKGDSVMTDKGFRVFRGARSLPYHRSDFSSLANSGLDGKNRSALDTLERATLRATRVTGTSPGPNTARARAQKSKPQAVAPAPAAPAAPGFQGAAPRRVFGPQASLAFE